MGFLNVKDSLPKELEYFSSKRKAIISLGVPCFHAREILRFLLPAPHRKIPPTFKHSLSLIDHLSAVLPFCLFVWLGGSIIVEWIWLVLAFRCTFFLRGHLLLLLSITILTDSGLNKPGKVTRNQI